MSKNKEEEISRMARKAVKLKESSLRTLIFATDILFARDQMECDPDSRSESCTTSNT